MKTASNLVASFLLVVVPACGGDAKDPDLGLGGGTEESPAAAASSTDGSAVGLPDGGTLDAGPSLVGAEAGNMEAGTADAGGGGGDAGDDAGSVALALRTSAATQTAATASACVGIRPFYWEVGDGASALASGSEGGTTYTQSSTMNIASASKWFYSSYWVERTNGNLSATDIKFMNFWSGYTNFSSCSGAATVGGCLAIGQNGVFDPTTENKFDYGGGHMQKHADMNGLGALTNATLADEIRSKVGTDIGLAYSTPQLAGGAVTSAGEYAKLLRKIVTGTLQMHAALGTHAVCTNPGTCPTAIHAPSPKGESWHYSVGHWVEDDPAVGDGAFSSPGAFGFYPWIDASKRFYGVVARVDAAGAIASVKCGRLIRKAWLTGQTQ